MSTSTIIALLAALPVAWLGFATARVALDYGYARRRDLIQARQTVVYWWAAALPDLQLLMFLAANNLGGWNSSALPAMGLHGVVLDRMSDRDTKLLAHKLSSMRDGNGAWRKSRLEKVARTFTNNDVGAELRVPRINFCWRQWGALCAAERCLHRRLPRRSGLRFRVWWRRAPHRSVRAYLGLSHLPVVEFSAGLKSAAEQFAATHESPRHTPAPAARSNG